VVSTADPAAAAQVAVTANRTACTAPADGAVGSKSALTRERFGWAPTHPGLIADIDDGYCFEE
jgi:hypothetical protein